jgi:hypothetical protein
MAKLEDLPPDVVADSVARAVVGAVSAGGDTESIVARALATVRGELGLNGAAPSGPGARSVPAATVAQMPTHHANGQGRPVVTEDDVRAAVAAGGQELCVGPRAIVTALARDAAKDTGIRLVEEA